MNVSWILTERLTGEVTDAGVNVTGASGRSCLLSLSPDATELTFDGERIEVGEDFAAYLGLLDELVGAGYSEPYEDSEDRS